MTLGTSFFGAYSTTVTALTDISIASSYIGICSMLVAPAATGTPQLCLSMRKKLLGSGCYHSDIVTC
jgi:hypothetical protein